VPIVGAAALLHDVPDKKYVDLQDPEIYSTMLKFREEYMASGLAKSGFDADGWAKRKALEYGMARQLKQIKHLLKSLPDFEPHVNTIVDVIKNVSYSGEVAGNKPDFITSTMPLMYVRDADRLLALGHKGICRAYSYVCKLKGDPDIPEEDIRCCTDPEKIKLVVEHWEEKLKHLHRYIISLSSQRYLDNLYDQMIPWIVEHGGTTITMQL
jgi:hypothetical protein